EPGDRALTAYLAEVALWTEDVDSCGTRLNGKRQPALVGRRLLVLTQLLELQAAGVCLPSWSLTVVAGGLFDFLAIFTFGCFPVLLSGCVAFLGSGGFTVIASRFVAFFSSGLVVLAAAFLAVSPFSRLAIRSLRVGSLRIG